MDIKDLHITIKRSKRVRNLNISVLPPDGRVDVSVPETMDDSDIRAFVIHKWAWIKWKQQEVAMVQRQNCRSYENGESHYFLGHRYRLLIEEKTAVAHRVRIEGRNMVMTIHPGTAVKNRGELLWEFYRAQLKGILTTLVADKMREFEEEQVTWEIKRMRTQWGSCMTNRRHLLFNLELARLSMDSIKYIVVHELTHLQEKNHTMQFKKLMEVRFPNWQKVQKEMNSFVATNYDYTPNWIAEISRMASVANEGNISNVCVVRAFLAVCQLYAVKSENFILSSENVLLAQQFNAVCPLADVVLSKALEYCNDTEFYISTGDGLAIKSLWVAALADSEFLQKVIRHADVVLANLVREYRKAL